MTNNNQDKIESRCECGNLIFKITNNGIELKCNRCKRIKLVPFSEKKKNEDLLNIIQ